MNTDSTNAFAPPVAEVEPQIDTSLAGPWRRWLARSIDLGVLVFVLALGGGFAITAFSNPLAEFIQRPGGNQVFSMVLAAVALIADAVIVRVFGNSPAKALLGVRVLSREGAPLTFGEYVRRNLRLLVRGLGLGIPIITLIAMARQHGRVKAGRPAGYDERAGTRVVAKPIGALRALAAIAIYLVFVSVVVLTFVSEKVDLVGMIRTRGNAPEQTWTNTETGLDVTIEGFWKPTPSTDPSGLRLTTFSEPLDRAAVVFTKEVAEGFDLPAYVDAFQAASAANMNFIDSGSFFEKSGQHAWVCRASAANSPAHRMEITIVQYDANFWRTVKVQSTPTSATDEIADRLCAELWTTVE